MKTYISNLVQATRFWNNLYQVRSKTKYCKGKLFKSRWEQENQRA